uniref:HTH myb-type domain-containing protein n=1 Tax=Nelumbo nucifera TaxID=4432 RepID=A0A822ZGR8_NELNU|nr:TPA_asm: hypothetical protein HUJ06_000845 [Nelumbo nucifera]
MERTSLKSRKSCRLQWLNYLRPDIKRGNISAEEEELLIKLHRLLGNRIVLLLWLLMHLNLVKQKD